MEGGPPCFAPGFTCPALLGMLSLGPRVLRVRGFHPLWPAVPGRSPEPSVSDPTPPLQRRDGESHDPTCGNAWRLTRARV